VEALNSIQNLFPGAGSQQATASDNQLAQEDFLKLLVAQLENQDPSKPVENGEFLAQIAQFSMVEGIGGLERSFEQLADSLQRNQVADAASLLGKEVLFDSSQVSLRAGGGIDGRVSLGSAATDVQLKVLDTAGITVASRDLGNLGAGSRNFSWDGRGPEDRPVAAGDYRVVITGSIAGVPQSLPVQLYGRVEGVAVDPQSRELSLELNSGASLGLSDVYEFK
jgi:flagellar basal-body rod modification protein FlgD